MGQWDQLTDQQKNEVERQLRLISRGVANIVPDEALNVSWGTSCRIGA